MSTITPLQLYLARMVESGDFNPTNPSTVRLIAYARQALEASEADRGDALVEIEQLLETAPDDCIAQLHRLRLFFLSAEELKDEVVLWRQSC